MNLRYKLMLAPNGHPQQVMKDLGINYTHSTPQSMGDQWWFWNCTNVPESMPDYLSELTIKPMSAIGRGLNRSEAMDIMGKVI